MFLASMVAAALASPILEWFGAHPERVPGLWYVVVASARLFFPSFILLLAGIHCDAAPERRVLSLAALAFALVATAMLGPVYAIQLTVVRLGIAAGATAGLAQFISTNTASALFAVDVFGYGFLGLSALFAAPLFGGGGLERSIRRLLVANGVGCLAGPVGLVIPFHLLTLLGQALVMPLALVSATALLAVHFRRGLAPSPGAMAGLDGSEPRKGAAT